MVLISRVSVPRATAKNTQIRLAFVFLHAGWEPIEVRALIDTGAEVSLVRQGLFPPSFFKISPVPLKILGANEHRVGGGTLETFGHLEALATESIDRKKKYSFDFPPDSLKPTLGRTSFCPMNG